MDSILGKELGAGKRIDCRDFDIKSGCYFNNFDFKKLVCLFVFVCNLVLIRYFNLAIHICIHNIYIYN